MTTKRTIATRVVVVVAAAAALGGGFAIWHQRPASRHASSTAGEVVIDVTAERSDAGPSLANAVSSALFPLGAEQTYAMTQTSRLSTSAAQTLTQLGLHGSLKIVGLQTWPTILVRVEFEGAVEILAGAHDAGQVGQEAEASLTESVRRPFFLEFGPEGQFQHGMGDARSQAFVARMWTALGEYLQFVRASDADRWQVRESDKAGHYVADYERRAGGEVVKRKLRYETMSARGLQSVDILASRTQFQLDPEFALSSLDLSEDTRANAGGGPLPSFSASATLTLARTGLPARVDDRVATWLTDAASAVPFDKIQGEADERANDRVRIGTFTLAQAYERMRTFEGTDAGHDEKERASRAFVAFTALLRQNPENLGFVRSELATKGPMTTTLLAALRDASSPESLRVLAEMTAASSPLDPEDRVEAARALSRAPTPNAETVQALKALRSDPDVGTQATYGLGSALHRLMDQDPVAASDARQALAEQLSAATTEGGQAAVLTALGNAGDPASLEVIRAYATSPSVEVRAAAAQALRRIPGPEADQILAVLCTDAAPEVRFGAADAIGERPASPVLANALAMLALHEAVYQVRAKAVDTLADWLPNVPGIAPTLKVVASGDTDADLRNVAKGALERAG